MIYKNELCGSSSVYVRSSFDHSTLLVKEREKIILIDVTQCQIDLDKNLNRKNTPYGRLYMPYFIFLLNELIVFKKFMYN